MRFIEIVVTYFDDVGDILANTLHNHALVLLIMSEETNYKSIASSM